MSIGNFCILDTAVHPGDRLQDCSYFCFENNKEKIKECCQVLILNQTIDHTISIDKNFRAITMLNPRKLLCYLQYIFISI